MAANSPEIQVLSDNGKGAVIKINGYYTSAVNLSSKIITANTLAFANTDPAKNCVISITGLDYIVDMTTGYVQLGWVGASANTPIMTFGSAQSGSLEKLYLTNNAASPTGDINLIVTNAQPGDGYTFILAINKEVGYERAYVAYNDNLFKP